MDYMFQMKCAWHPTFPGAERPVPFFASFGGASFAVIAFTAVINNMASGPNQIGPSCCLWLRLFFCNTAV